MNTAYLLLKTANTRFGKAPAALPPDHLAAARRLAEKQAALESRVLAAPEARDAVVPEASVQAALAEIRSRYPDEAEFVGDLAGNGLTPDEYAQALAREMKVDAILEKVGARAAAVSEIDVELYFHYHPEQFRRPETRLARHILVTVNETLADNHRTAARSRIDAIAARLAREPKRFEEQAMKHSECPTALQGGVLGEVRPGQLYPELEAILFALDAGGIGPVVESTLGFHLLRCDRISPAGVLTLDEARVPIRAMLEARRKRTCQQAWLKTLRSAALA